MRGEQLTELTPAIIRRRLSATLPKYMLPTVFHQMAELPRNSAPNRYRNRCEITGRPRAVYRKHRLSRIALRELGSKGLIPGLVKSSW